MRAKVRDGWAVNAFYPVACLPDAGGALDELMVDQLAPDEFHGLAAIVEGHWHKRAKEIHEQSMATFQFIADPAGCFGIARSLSVADLRGQGVVKLPCGAIWLEAQGGVMILVGYTALIVELLEIGQGEIHFGRRRFGGALLKRGDFPDAVDGRSGVTGEVEAGRHSAVLANSRLTLAKAVSNRPRRTWI